MKQIALQRYSDEYALDKHKIAPQVYSAEKRLYKTSVDWSIGNSVRPKKMSRL